MAQGVRFNGEGLERVGVDRAIGVDAEPHPVAHPAGAEARGCRGDLPFRHQVVQLVAGRARVEVHHDFGRAAVFRLEGSIHREDDDGNPERVDARCLAVAERDAGRKIARTRYIYIVIDETTGDGRAGDDANVLVVYRRIRDRYAKAFIENPVVSQDANLDAVADPGPGPVSGPVNANRNTLRVRDLLGAQDAGNAGDQQKRQSRT